MKKKTFVIRSKHVSFQLEGRGVKLLLLLLAGVITAGGLSLALGDYLIHPYNTLKALFGEGTKEDVLVIQTLRFPRLIIGLLVGVSLAVSGAILQGLLKNPLAAPDVIGVTGGASVGAVLFIIYLSTTWSAGWLPVAAMAGAVCASLLIYGLAWNKGVSPLRIILVGIGLAAAMSAATTYLIILSPMHTATQAYIWLTGTVYGSTWENVRVLLPWTLTFLAFTIMLTRHIQIQQLEDDVAQSVGSPLQKHRLLLILVSVALAGSAVSMGGVIGFVGLIAPHMARRLTGAVSSFYLPVAALLGGIIVVVADLIARTAFLPLDIPVGVFTSGVGAPFFIYLLYRTRNVR